MMSNSRNVGPSLHKAANCAGRHAVAEANIDGEFEMIGGTPSFTEDPPGARAEVDPPRAFSPDIGAVPTLNVADNVRLVLELNKVPSLQASKRIHELLDSVGLADRAESYPDILSGGEQQRVAIARALAHEPAVLLADEPTGNLDDITAEGVLGLLNKLVRDSSHTMLIATHSQHIASHCDRVLELQNGQLKQTTSRSR